MNPEIPAPNTQIDAVLADLQQNCTKEMTDEVQHALGDLVKALNMARQHNELQLISTIVLGIKTLTGDKPNLTLAKDITACVMAELKSTTKFSPPVRVVIGLGFLLYVAIPILSFVLPRWMDEEKLLTVPTELFLMVALFGATGSIVSIMVRIQDFVAVNVHDNFILYFTGAFKPIIGMAFALFIFALINSGLIPVIVQKETANYFFMAISFLAGFSERFARDIVVSIEEGLNKNIEKSSQ